MRCSGREQQPQPGSPKPSVFLGTPCSKVLGIFQTCSRLQACRIFSVSALCMESMFKMLSQHTACPQASPWVFLFLLLCFQGFGTAAGCSSSTLFCPLPFPYFIFSAPVSLVTPDCCHMYCPGSIPSQ